MNRYLLNISYIGTNFRGIQKTINKSEAPKLDTSTVQGAIELALNSCHPVNEIQTVLSSRTDAGVHALHSTLHVNLESYDKQPFNTKSLTSILNRTLNRKNLHVRVLSVQHVPDTFHCRFNALARTYIYRIAVAKNSSNAAGSLKNRNYEAFLPVEELDRCYFLQNTDFDIERCRAATNMFIGRHDFRTFMSTSGNKNSRDHPTYTLRQLESVEIKPGRSLSLGDNAIKAQELYNYWDIEIKGRSFLYKQVRRIVGTLIALGTNIIDERCIYQMLTIPSKHTWHPRILPAPAFGLYLCRVHYDDKDFLFKQEQEQQPQLTVAQKPSVDEQLVKAQEQLEISEQEVKQKQQQ